MKVVSGIWNGTGAAVYICCGFIPDRVRVWDNTTTASYGELIWQRNNRVDAVVEGFTLTTGTTYRQIAACTVAGGIEPYEGGDLMTSSNQTSVTYGEGVYLYQDPIEDYKSNASFGYTSSPLTDWTLDTSANRTGHFNDDVPTSVARIGAGSIITIKEANTQYIKRAVINVLTAGQGISADEVELSRAIKTGTILHVGGKFDFIPIPVGEVTPAGFKLSEYTINNINNAQCGFEAILFND